MANTRTLTLCIIALLGLLLYAESFQLSVSSNRHLGLSSTSLSSMTSSMSGSVSKKIQTTLDPCIVLMKEMIGAYAQDWEDRGGIYSLAQGVVYWKPPPSTHDALLEAVQSSEDDDNLLHMYGPDEGLSELRDALQEKIQTENGLTNHHVMVTMGANQAYVNCVLTLLDNRDKAVVFKPYYFNHVMALQMTMANAQEQLLVGPSDAHGVPDLDWLETQLQEDPLIRIVTITNPCNPTGVRLELLTLQRAVDLCRAHNVWLVLDCTYEYFIPSDASLDGCFSDPHVIHIFSLSKAYALAGYRCGYMTMSKASDPLYREVMKVQDTIPICPSRISQVAALGALKAGRDWVRGKVETLATGRAAILKALEPCDEIIGGSGAMYIMCKVGGDDQEFARRLVKDFGVAVIPGSFCGYPGWLRVCYANLPPETCSEAAARLAAGIEVLLSELR